MDFFAADRSTCSTPEQSPAGGTNWPLATGLFTARAVTAEELDRLWLDRVVLQTRSDVYRNLESVAFESDRGRILALYVDKGLGLICSEPVGSTMGLDPEALVHKVLRLGSDHQADGMFLATNDPTGGTARGCNFQSLTMKLSRTGMLIGIPLIDHFVLTAAGWKSMFALNAAERL